MTRDHSPDGAADACGTAIESACARRSVLRGALALGVAGIGGALTGCGGGSSSDTSLTSAQGSTSGTGTSAAAAPAGGGATTGAATTGGKKGGSAKGGRGIPLGPASKVPVGGGVIYGAARVVVTQPTAGVYKAFDANCTHEKCLVAEVADGTINCACHGAKFSITDGANTAFFPITDPLPAKTVKVAGGKLWVT